MARIDFIPRRETSGLLNLADMTDQEICELPAGRELDRLVAWHVFRRREIRPYSSDFTEGWKVITRTNPGFRRIDRPTKSSEKIWQWFPFHWKIEQMENGWRVSAVFYKTVRVFDPRYNELDSRIYRADVPFDSPDHFPLAACHAALIVCNSKATVKPN